MSIADLRKLSAEVAANPEITKTLEHDQTTALRKYLNPLGNVIQAKKSYANISIINLAENYMRKLVTTAMISYLYRLASEYVPEDGDAKEHRSIINAFLDRHFSYNPDKHVRGAHTSNPLDPERKTPAELKREVNDVIENKLSSRPESLYSYSRDCLLYSYSRVKELTAATKGALSALSSNLSTDDQQGILLRKYSELSAIDKDMSKIVEPLVSRSVNYALNEPPADLFYHFDRYLSNHYEQLREVTEAVYGDKPDLEFAVLYYDSFKSAEDAREYRIQHEAEFKYSVYTVENSAVCLLGPFKENRDRADFYNKNTEIMKQMMDQLAIDHKLGKDLMEKAVRDKKKKNIEEVGPDAPGLAQYSKIVNKVKELGARKIRSAEEEAALKEAEKQAEDTREALLAPDDSVLVDVFAPRMNEAGELELDKKRFYTKAEAPLHMEHGSEFVDKYQ